MNNEYDMIDLIDGENDPEVLGHLNVSWEGSGDMDSPDHDDIVGWESDDWQDEGEYDDYQDSPYDEIYWED